MHECKKIFKTEKIDKCKGYAYNRCFGDRELTFEVWFEAQDGTEECYDNWQCINVNFCPYCGYQPERLNEKTCSEGFFPPPWNVNDHPEKTEGWIAFQKAIRNNPDYYRMR